MNTLISRRRCALSIASAVMLPAGRAVGQDTPKQPDTIKPEFIGFSSEDWPVLAEINGTRLRIPRNFVEVAIVQLREPGLSSERQAGWLRLVAFLPDFSGMTSERVKTVRASSSTRYPDLISVNIRPNDDPWSQGLKQGREEQASKATVPFKDGLLTSPSGRDDLFRPAAAKDGEPIKISVNGAWTDKGFCMIDLFRWSNMSVEYEYNASHLDQWEEIDSGVTHLVNSILETH